MNINPKAAANWITGDVQFYCKVSCGVWVGGGGVGG